MDLGGLHESESRRAYSFALRMLGDAAAAEDAVAEAFALLVEGRAEAPNRAALLGLVRRVAIDAWRSERSRRAREEARSMQTHTDANPAEASASLELARAARSAMQRLSIDERTAVALSCEQGLGPAEIAGVMDMPLETVRSHRRRGLERLREMLAAGGFAGAVLAGVEGVLGSAPMEALPASLAARLDALGVAKNAAGPVTGAAAKGGLIVKIGLAFAAMGLVAGGAFWAAGGRTEEPAKPAAASTAAPRKFDIPIWHPDARFEVIKLGGVESRDAIGFLDGPTGEMEQGSLGRFGPGYANIERGRMFYGWYDPATGRGHRVAGNGWGYLDGPFSRARFGNRDYGWNPPDFPDGEGRYSLIADKWNGVINIRCLDFDKQEVRTVVPNVALGGAAGFRGIATRADGKFHLLSVDGTLSLIDPADGKKQGEQKVDMAQCPMEKGFIRTFPLVLDEAHNRLYCAHTNDKWWLWYWDLKDGSFHGVFPKSEKGLRAKDVPGPFEGSMFYHECGNITFGPDDPERRFVYMTRVDTWQVFRIDLEKKEVATLKAEVGGRGFPKEVSFSTTEGSRVPAYFGHGWLFDGSGFVSTTHSPTTCFLFKRIK